ncbi:glyoxylase-like metal-dependent hydrolase (beta-lactamase superfamily II) [Deinobacterium chartae]|uniref:Glyoxylase-like metal-dependent hydrolase (Beta-lactamase superfamily II) n=1 Tax=Deinobacterium chartae TaxID=521158 RepID=A0A841I4K6_9DEIO|nr:MBL fold metallo-hydrolase [Deinobacterium chartae]MBB6099229.1 glyoxylase-like metal-dependent hydrolase (beta-lactamase superfamily II) [Deinobacterium chartae]
MLIPVTGSLYAVQIPIPYPMKYVTVLIDAARPVTLIDTALDTPEAVAALNIALAELRLTFADIERVIITHHHPDHYGLAGWIQEQSDAAVMMLDLDIARGERYWSQWEGWLAGHARHFAEHGLPSEMLTELEAESAVSRSRVRPARYLTPLHEGDRVTLSGLEFEVLWMPGHADGHLTLWNAAQSLLIAGDVILERITPNVGLYAYSRPDPLGDYLATLTRLELLQPQRTVTGHYGPIIEGAAERAREIREHHLERLELCRTTLRTPMDTFQMSRVMFPRDLNASGRRFALAETLAHLEHLRLHGHLARELRGGVWWYSR